MYVLKEKPEDFVVEEVLALKLQEQGRYAVFQMHKRYWDSEAVAWELSKRLRLPRRQLGLTGNKDRHALTTQHLSIPARYKTALDHVRLRDVTLTFRGCLDDPITIGAHEGNRFRIIVRNLTQRPAGEGLAVIPNYFDEQRFGAHNAEVGKALAQGEFSRACALCDELKVKLHLDRAKNDYIGALRQLPHKTLLLMLHAYQSLLFNQCLSEHLTVRYPDAPAATYRHGEMRFPATVTKRDLALKLPLIGFEYEPGKSGVDKLCQRVLTAEGITPRDFIIRSVPYLSAPGGTRTAFAVVKEFVMGALVSDELNPGKRSMELRFFLPKGSFATVAVRALFAR